MMEISLYNRRAWDHQVGQGNRWTVPVTSEIIAAARTGDWQVVLTPLKPVSSSWFPNLNGLKILGLASGGGQQAPIFAAAGATVTVLDNSPKQLEQDQFVAQRDNLQITSVLGDMRDLSSFPAESFDLVFNPCSVSFIPDVHRVFAEVYRVLRPQGVFMGGFINPLRFLFDEAKLKDHELVVRHQLPYSDQTHLNGQELDQLQADGEPLMFSHSLEDLIAGQCQAGFVLRDFFEDTSPEDILSENLPTYFGTLAEKRKASLPEMT